MEPTASAPIAVQTVRLQTIAIVGLVRNGAGKIIQDVLRMQLAVRSFATVHWLLIESDSSDDSLIELEKLSNRIDNFRFLALGSLRDRFPLRTDRISFCRNVYLEELRSNSVYKQVAFIIVSDFDGINTLISEKAILSCWKNSDWSVCTANQAGPYYDILALRHPVWCASDCVESYQFLIMYGVRPERALQAAIHSRMITIPSESPWIEVDSSFGGVAVYRREEFLHGEYRGLSSDGREVCEHVHFHGKIKAQGGRIFINPALINAGYTEHTLPLRFSQKIGRVVKNVFKPIYKGIFGRQGLAR